MLAVYAAADPDRDREQERVAVPARDLAPVRAPEASPDTTAAERAPDERLLWSAVLLRADRDAWDRYEGPLERRERRARARGAWERAADGVAAERPGA